MLDGIKDGLAVGDIDGCEDGRLVGILLGSRDGIQDGIRDGSHDGLSEGAFEGPCSTNDCPCPGRIYSSLVIFLFQSSVPTFHPNKSIPTL